MEPVPTLCGPTVTLRPLEPTDAGALWAVAADPDVWRYMTRRVDSPERLAAWIDERRAPMADGTARPFCLCLGDTGRPIGSTSLFAIDRPNRRAEIGHTWLARRWWGTGINLEAKRLLLAHAFETLKLTRVQLKTDRRNLPAQAAIERLGATREGILRRHDVLPDGHVRDAVVYSILRGEWPYVRETLDVRLGPLANLPRRT